MTSTPATSGVEAPNTLDSKEAQSTQEAYKIRDSQAEGQVALAGALVALGTQAAPAVQESQPCLVAVAVQGPFQAALAGAAQDTQLTPLPIVAMQGTQSTLPPTGVDAERCKD